ncbi:MAG: DUF342 domain-containing protein [Candidatus Magnetomorum sp.]|nr:DUF342 domain-containing protein [Candidatus Magnetomorum sp.]
MKKSSNEDIPMHAHGDKWLDDQDHFLLKRILKYEMANQEQIQKGLALYYQYKMAKKPIRLGGVLVQNGIITQNELDLFDTFQDMNKVTEMDRSFAALALKNKLVTLDNIKQAFHKQAIHFKKTKKILLLGNILTQLGMMTSAYRDAILSRQKRLDTKYEDASFGAVAITMGLATRDQIDDALATQQKIFSMTNQLQLIGNILVDKNVLTNAQTRQILIHQKELKLQAEQKERERKTMKAQTKKQNIRSEKISFIDIQEYITIIVSKDFLEARILPIKSLPEDTTLDDILFILAEKNIKYGIVDHYQIRKYLKNPLLQQSPWLIARGKTPVPPESPSIKYTFQYMLDKTASRSNESINHVTWKNWPKIKKKELLAERTPGQEGIPGISVYAEIIDVETSKTVQLMSGMGTQLSADGNQLIALQDGLISSYMRNKICVLPEKVIEGDLELTKESFRYAGALHVKGIIKGKNTIACTMLFAKGIEQAEIHIETDMIILGDISNACIHSKGNVVAQNIRHSTIEAFGDVITEHNIESSRLVSSGKVSVLKGSVKETDINAFQGILAHAVESAQEKNCTLSIGKDYLLNEQVKKINTKLPPLKDNLQKLAEYIDRIKTTLTQINDNQKKLTTYIQTCNKMKDELALKEDLSLEDKQKRGEQIDQKMASATKKFKAEKQRMQKSKENYIRYNKSYQQHFKQVKHLNEELISLKDWLSDKHDQPGILISDTVHAGTRMISPHCEMILEKDHARIYIKEISSQLKIESLSDTPN